MNTTTSLHEVPLDDDDFSMDGTNREQAVDDAKERGEIGEKLAHKGHKAVKGLRIGLFASLVLATVVASGSIFYYTRHQEEVAFEDAFFDNSLKLVEAFQSTAERRLSAVASFSTSITSYAMAVNATWPFVTVPQFEARASHVLNLAEAIAIAFAPLVDLKDRATWENEYVPNNIKWIEESFQYQEEVLQLVSEETSAINDAATVDDEEGSNSESAPPPTYEGMPDFSAGYSKQIFTTGFTPFGSLGPIIADGDSFLPWWQRAPSVRSEGAGFVNIDLVDDPSFDGDLLQVLQRPRAALGRMTFGGYTADTATPISGFYYPVIEDMDMYNPEARLVGTVATLVYWDTFFANILPLNANGIIAVLSSTCNQTVTFQVDGPDVTVLGQEDLHDANYDDFRLDVSFSATINERSASRSYLGFPFDEQGCQYTLSVYASEEFEDIYVSHMPIVYCVGAIFIFVLTSGLFLLYDRLVTNRQKAILRQAEQSGAIVSSLFPAMYRDRLMKAHEEALKRKQNKDNKGVIKAFTNSSANDTNETLGDSDEPIADLYQDCTVLFADVSLPKRPFLSSFSFFRAHTLPFLNVDTRLLVLPSGVAAMTLVKFLRCSRRWWVALLGEVACMKMFLLLPNSPCTLFVLPFSMLHLIPLQRKGGCSR